MKERGKNQKNTNKEKLIQVYKEKIYNNNYVTIIAQKRKQY